MISIYNYVQKAPFKRRNFFHPKYLTNLPRQRLKLDIVTLQNSRRITFLCPVYRHFIGLVQSQHLFFCNLMPSIASPNSKMYRCSTKKLHPSLFYFCSIESLLSALLHGTRHAYMQLANPNVLLATPVLCRVFRFALGQTSSHYKTI